MAQQYQSGTIRVVTLDDHHLVREGIRSLIAESPEVELVDEGWVGEHLEPLVERHKPDIVLLDLGMPEKDNMPLRTAETSFRAFPTIASLRQRYPQTRIIVISQYVSKALIEGAIEAGVSGYLLKDDALSRLHLVEAIRAIHMGGFYLSGEVSRQLSDLQSPSADSLLTKRQQEIIQAIAVNPDLSYAQHARQLGISEHTFSNHLRQIFERLEVGNLTAAIIKAIQLGIVSVTADDHSLRWPSFDI